MKERRHDIDWIRVIAMFCVFIFHCTRFFDNEGWHVKAPLAQQSEMLATLRFFIMWVWLMEIFFLVSGFATRYVLQRRTAARYLSDRARRLLLPIYTVGLVLIVPPQYYLELFTHNKIDVTFWRWLPTFFRNLPGQIFSIHNYLDPIQLVPYTFSGHFWFIQMLFLVCLITLPAIFYLKSASGQRFVARLADWSTRGGGIFLFVIPLSLARIGLQWLPRTTDRTWGDFLWYAIYFLIGYILACDDRFTESIKRHTWTGLTLWVAPFFLVGGMLMFVFGYDPSSQGFSWMFVVWQITYGLISWASVIFLMSLAGKALSFSNKLLDYSNEAVLPFFIFHQTVILVVGWFVMPWDIGALLKFLIVACVSFPVILFLYEVFVRRIDFMRFLFGMTPKKKALPTAKQDSSYPSTSRTTPAP